MTTRGEEAGRPGFRPVHPGVIVKRNIEALSVTVEEFANRINVSRQNVHAILNGSRAVSPDMAVRLGNVFKTSPQFWLNMQNNHDVWEPQREPSIQRIKPFKWITSTAKTTVRDAIGSVRGGAQPVTASKRDGTTMQKKRGAIMRRKGRGPRS